MSIKAFLFLAAVAPLAIANGTQGPTSEEERERLINEFGAQESAADIYVSAIYSNPDFVEGMMELATMSHTTRTAGLAHFTEMVDFMTHYPVITNTAGQAAVSSVYSELHGIQRRDIPTAVASAIPTPNIGTSAEGIEGGSPSQDISSVLALATSVIGTSAEGQEGGSPNDSSSANPLKPTITIVASATGTETAASSITSAVVAGTGVNPTPADVLFCELTATDAQGQVTGACAQVVASFTQTFNAAGTGSASTTGTDSSASTSATVTGSAEVTPISTDSNGSTLFATIQSTDAASTFLSSVTAAPSGVATPSGGLSSGFTSGGAPMPTIAAGAAYRSGVTMGAIVAAVAGAAFFL